jgi:hypothetical protein
MKKPMFFWLFFSFTACFGASRFILDAELRTNYTDNAATTQFLTGYTYGSNGNRILSRSWNGSDSTAALISEVKYSYDISGLPTEELLLSGADTLTIVRYKYGGGKLSSVRILSKSGTLRYADSLIYNGQGREIEERRISSSGVKTSFHRYTLNDSGKTVADSLFELVSSSYVATQALYITYKSDSTTVATETQWRMSGNSWYCISTSFMNYSAGSLISVATHERNGAGTAMTDSLAYSYDGFGNKIKEEDFDGSKSIAHRIMYTWRDTQTKISISASRLYGDNALSFNYANGILSVNRTLHYKSFISVFDMRGRRICQVPVGNSGIVPLNGLIGKGSYIAIFTNRTQQQTLNITLFN